MSTSRGFKDRTDESLLTLVGEVPELVKNLVVAEVESAKTWAKNAAKDAGIGSGFFIGALFLLFWAIPVLLTFAVAGIASWWPVWLSALVVLGGLLLIAVVLALLGLWRFKHIAKDNPADAAKTDAMIVKEAAGEH